MFDQYIYAYYFFIIYIFLVLQGICSSLTTLILCKIFKMPVETFTLGFGPSVFRYVHRNTLYDVKCFPGYAGAFNKKWPSFKITDKSFESLKSEGLHDNILKRLEGIKNQEFMEEKKFLESIEIKNGNQQTGGYDLLILKYAKEFEKPKIYQRLLVEGSEVIGAALFMITIILSCWGYNKILNSNIENTTLISKIDSQSAADEAGIKNNDRIISISNLETKNWEDVIYAMKTNLGKTVKITLIRDSKKVEMNLNIPINHNLLYDKTGIAGLHNKDEHRVILPPLYTFLITAKVFIERRVLKDFNDERALLLFKQRKLSWLDVLPIFTIFFFIINLIPFHPFAAGRITYVLWEFIQEFRGLGLPPPEAEERWKLIGWILMPILLITIPYWVEL